MNNTPTTNTWPRQTFVLPITLGTETRDVEFTVALHGKSAFSGFIFASRIGRGAKLHAAGMTAWLQADGTWKAARNTVALNRQATIVAFRDEVRDANKSQHHGSAITRTEATS